MSSGSADLHVVSSPGALYAAAAEEFEAVARDAIRKRGHCRVALAGGTTPRGLYSLLAAHGTTVAWPSLSVFFGDERHVPPDHHDSNYRMAFETLLARVPIPAEAIHRIPAEMPSADAAARVYERILQQMFRLRVGEVPRFDLVLLGMGADGHTASLFPDSPALKERSRLVVATYVEKLKAERITLTLPVLDNAANVLFMVSGVEKARAVREVVSGTPAGQAMPAAMVQPKSGRLVWLLDRDAAGTLGERS